MGGVVWWCRDALVVLQRAHALLSQVPDASPASAMPRPACPSPTALPLAPCLCACLVRQLPTPKRVIVGRSTAVVALRLESSMLWGIQAGEAES